MKKKFEKEQNNKPVHSNVNNDYDEDDKFKKKKKNKNKFKTEDLAEYLDNFKPSKPFVEPFKFKKKKDETHSKFMKRVDRETTFAVNKAKLDMKYEVSVSLSIPQLTDAFSVLENY